MTILSDHEIAALCLKKERPLISPYVPEQVRQAEDGQRQMSFGPSSYGYDIRLAREFKFLDPRITTPLDPLNVKESDFAHLTDVDEYIIPPNDFVLGRSLEFFYTPTDVTGLVLSKSTYLRVGIYSMTSVIEAGWSGNLVLEYANLTRRPMILRAGQGSAQILFLRGAQCLRPYEGDRKYQGQTGITLSRA